MRYTYIDIYTCPHKYIPIHICTYIYIHVQICIYAEALIHLHTSAYAHLCTCIQISYVCIYLFSTHMYTYFTSTLISYMRIFICMNTFSSINVTLLHIKICVGTHTYTMGSFVYSMRANINTYIYIHTYTYTCIFAHTYIYIYTCIFAHTYIHIHKHIHIYVCNVYV